jgi:hypothetical protein
MRQLREGVDHSAVPLELHAIGQRPVKNTAFLHGEQRIDPYGGHAVRFRDAGIAPGTETGRIGFGAIRTIDRFESMKSKCRET